MKVDSKKTLKGEDNINRSILRTACMLITILVITVISVPLVLADDVSNSDRLLCATLQAMRCTAESGCQTVSPLALNIPDFVEIDLAKKKLQTTIASGLNRVTLISTLTKKNGHIFIQGTEEGRSFSFDIDQQSGDLTAAVSSDGTVIAGFSVCTPLLKSREK